MNSDLGRLTIILSILLLIVFPVCRFGTSDTSVFRRGLRLGISAI